MEVLPIGRDNVYKLLRTNQIPCKRVGRQYYIPKSAFIEWVNTPDPSLHMDGQANTSAANGKAG